METSEAIGLMQALAQSTRIRVFRHLVEAGSDGRAAGEIAVALGLPPATLSFHLKEMSRAGLVRSRQAGRSMIYAADFARVRTLLGFLTDNCCGGLSCELSSDPRPAPERAAARAEVVPLPRTPARRAPASAASSHLSMEVAAVSHAPRNILFLCTGNSARSIFAESIMNALARGRYRAYSAGSHPTGQVNPFALELIAKQGLPTGDLRSKNWDEFAVPGAPPMDFVITVCDRAAGEVCPVWPGQPVTAHWGFIDPAAAQGNDEEKRRVFARVYHEIAHRVRLFLDLPVEKLDRLAIEREVRKIGAA
jgi:arsenate reductase